MQEWLQSVAGFFKEYGGIVSCGVFFGYVLLQLYKDWRAARLDRERVAIEKAMQTELDDLRKQNERESVLDNELRKDLAECWKTQAQALRAKLALFYNNDRPRHELLDDLLKARTGMKNRFYDSLYLPQGLIEMMQDFDGLLRDAWISPDRLYSANGAFREAMRAAAGLNHSTPRGGIEQPERARRPEAADGPGGGASLADGKSLLVEAIREVTAANREPFVRMSALKQALLKLDPAFDEAAYGFETFTQFVNACDDVVRVTQGPHEKHVSLAEAADVAEAAPAPPSSSLEHFRQILRRQQYRMLPGGRFIPLCRAVCAAANDGPFASWEDFPARVRERAPQELRDSLTDAELSRLKQLLFKNHVFDLRGAHGIFVEQQVSSPEAMVELVFRNTIRRLISQPDLHWDAKAASQLLYGDDAHAAQVDAWYSELREDGVAAA
jgi:hypothetical protein